MLDIKNIIKTFYAVTNIHNYSKLILCQSCMYAISHLLWKKIATLCTNTLCVCKTTQNPGIYHYRLLVEEIAYGNGFMNSTDFINYLEKYKI